MQTDITTEKASGLRGRVPGAILAIAIALGLSGCTRTETTSSAAKPAPAASPAVQQGAVLVGGPEEEYGEYLARPEELAPVASNDIVKSLRLNSQAMKLGRVVYDRECAQCHGADLKGIPAQHTPDLTDNVWRFSGDDVASGGVTKLPSDVEWTVRYGIRSGNPNARAVEVDMLAFNPQFRNPRDLADFGKTEYLNAQEIDDVAEYVLQLGNQQHDDAKAAHGAVLFQDNAKGNCFDCHAEDGTGILAFGSTNLTAPNLYLYGSDRASIVESITKGRFGVMPAFEGKLKPEELKAVSVYAFAQAKP